MKQHTHHVLCSELQLISRDFLLESITLYSNEHTVYIICQIHLLPKLTNLSTLVPGTFLSLDLLLSYIFTKKLYFNIYVVTLNTHVNCEHTNCATQHKKFIHHG